MRVDSETTDNKHLNDISPSYISRLDAISFGFPIGPPACSFKSFALPSQNWAILKVEFKTVGELIGPCCQLCP
jgi:hypothetical protein